MGRIPHCGRHPLAAPSLTAGASLSLAVDRPTSEGVGMTAFGAWLRGCPVVGAPVLVAAALLGSGGAGALAATPIDLGPATGSGPGLALTASGAAALSYASEEAPGADTLHYCRIDPGAGACSAATVL